MLLFRQPSLKKTSLDLETKFEFTGKLTAEHHAFYQAFGYLHFKHVFKAETIKSIRASIHQAQATILKEDIRMMNGVPIIFGEKPDGTLIPQRIPYLQLFSEDLNQFIHSSAAKELTTLIPNGRIGTNERDGVIVNHFLNNPKSNMRCLAWHTDSLRDLFYLEKIRPMLNVGIHVSPSRRDCGLYVLPGTHNQSLFSTLFRKIHFVSNKPDKHEVYIAAEPGDLTLHDGRLWHRATAPAAENNDYRQSIYFPILCGSVKEKTERSRPPLYLRFAPGVRPKK